MKNFRTFDLAVEFYRLSRTLRLPMHLKEQFSRAASSVALNLAEGRGKKTMKDQARFFQIALGSIRECEAILMLAEEKDQILSQKLDALGASTFKLIRNSGA